MTLSAATGDDSRPGAIEALSGRQVQCLSLASEGLTSAEIGVRVGLSSRTVDEHLFNACRALGVRTRVQAVARLAVVDRIGPEPRPFLP